MVWNRLLTSLTNKMTTLTKKIKEIFTENWRIKKYSPSLCNIYTA